MKTAKKITPEAIHEEAQHSEFEHTKSLGGDAFEISEDEYVLDYDEIVADVVDAKYSNIQVGDVIKFGKYKQGKPVGNKPIEWLVLDIKDARALLISKHCLDAQSYNKRYNFTTWEECTLRNWLNNKFLSSAFTKNEKAQIEGMTVSADKNPKYVSPPGNATEDKIFLLSAKQAKKYFTPPAARAAKPSEYALAQGTAVKSPGGGCCWWLRTPGNTQRNAACVDHDGSIDSFGRAVYREDSGVRPAMWINLD